MAVLWLEGGGLIVQKTCHCRCGACGCEYASIFIAAFWLEGGGLIVQKTCHCRCEACGSEYASINEVEAEQLALRCEVQQKYDFRFDVGDTIEIDLSELGQLRMDILLRACKGKKHFPVYVVRSVKFKDGPEFRFGARDVDDHSTLVSL